MPFYFVKMARSEGASRFFRTWDGGSGVSTSIRFKAPRICACCGEGIVNGEEGKPISIEGYSAGQVGQLFVDLRRCKLCSDHKSFYDNSIGCSIWAYVLPSLFFLIAFIALTNVRSRSLFLWVGSGLAILLSLLCSFFLVRHGRHLKRKLSVTRRTACCSDDYSPIDFVNRNQKGSGMGNQLVFRCSNREFAQALADLNGGQMTTSPP